MNFECRVVLPYTTGLPKDVSTNTFSVAEPVTTDPAVSAQQIALWLIQFYNGGSGDEVRKYISTAVSRGVDACRVDVYDREAPEPRAPLASVPFTLGAVTGGTTQMPLETAVCLSFQGARASGQPQARRRGRIYLGPLQSNAITMSLNNTPVPNSTFITDVLDAAEALYDNLVGDGFVWTVWSSVNNSPTIITECWMDNALDNQRRRELPATTRTTRVVNP